MTTPEASSAAGGFNSPRHVGVRKAQNLGLRLERPLEKKDASLRSDEGNDTLKQERRSLDGLHARAIGCESELLQADDADDVSAYTTQLEELEAKVLALEEAEVV